MNAEEIMIREHNALIEAQYNMSLLESKILSLIASDYNIEKGVEFKFRAFELARIFNVTKINTVDMIKLSISLPKISITILDLQNYNTKVINVFQGAKYENGVLTVAITDWIRPYIYHLTGNYTTSPKYTLEMSSVYTTRLYKLIREEMFKNIGFVELSVDKIRKTMLLEDKYASFKDFYKRIILDSVDEINERSTTITLDTPEKIKKGRNIVSIRFRYTMKNNLELTPDSAIESDKQISKVLDFKELTDFEKKTLIFISKEKLLEIMNEEITEDIIEEYITAQLIYTKKKKPKKLYAYLKKAVSGDYAEYSKKNNQISIDDIQEKVTPRKAHTKKSQKDFVERDYDYDALERKLLGWD